MNNPQNIKPGDKVRYVRMRGDGQTPPHYEQFLGLEFEVIGINTNGMSVFDLNGSFFYFDEVELVTEPKSMFEFGPHNEELKDRFINYLNNDRNVTGLCSGVNYTFMHNLIDNMQNFDPCYPIEYAIAQKNHKKRDFDTLEQTYSSQRTIGMTNPSTPYGKLRRWWAYNLALAVSQKEIV